MLAKFNAHLKKCLKNHSLEATVIFPNASKIAYKARSAYRVTFLHCAISGMHGTKFEDGILFADL